MKNAIALIAVAGIASVASAQNYSLSLVASVEEVAQGGSFTITVYGDADLGTHMLGGAFALSSDSALVSDITWANASWSQFNEDNFGYQGNGNYGQVVFGQLVLPGQPPFDQPADGSDLGMAIGSFTVTVVGDNDGMIDFSIVGGTPFSLEVIDINSGTSTNSGTGQLSLTGDSVLVTPAPSAMALLGLGGLVAGRRRR